MSRRLESTSLARLTLIGVDVWRRRSPGPAAPVELSGGLSSEPLDEAFEPRIRLLSGAGDWVLVQEQPWRGEHTQLLADIQAAIGTGRCRFGQWTEPGAAGSGPSELAARGIRGVLSFGPPPEPLDWPILVIGPPLAALAGQAEARRELWQRLAPHLAV